MMVMVTLQDVLHVLEQKSFIDIRVKMAKVLIKEMIKQQEKANEATDTAKKD
jgi:hypothetical protein